MADGISFGGGDDDGEQTMSYRNRYHQQPTLASRRHSEHNVMSPTAMTISGTGWNATWRSAHSGRPPAPVQKSPDPVVVDSADDALRVLLGDNAKVVPRKRNIATSQADGQVKGQESGSFNIRSSHNPPEMEENKSKTPVDDRHITHTQSDNYRVRSRIGQENTKSYDKDIDKSTTKITTNSSAPDKTRDDSGKADVQLKKDTPVITVIKREPSEKTHDDTDVQHRTEVSVITSVKRELSEKTHDDLTKPVVQDKKEAPVITVTKREHSDKPWSPRRFRTRETDSSPERELTKLTSSPVNRAPQTKRNVSPTNRDSSQERDSSPEHITVPKINSTPSKQPTVVLNQTPSQRTTPRAQRPLASGSDSLQKYDPTPKITHGSRKRETKWTSNYQRREGSPPRNEPTAQKKELIKKITDQLMSRGNSPAKTSSAPNKDKSDVVHDKVSTHHITSTTKVNSALPEPDKSTIKVETTTYTKDIVINTPEEHQGKDKHIAKETVPVILNKLSSRSANSRKDAVPKLPVASEPQIKDIKENVSVLPTPLQPKQDVVHEAHLPSDNVSVSEELPVFPKTSSLIDPETVPILPMTSPPKGSDIGPPLTPLSPSILPDQFTHDEPNADFVSTSIPMSRDVPVTPKRDVEMSIKETKPNVEVSTFSLQMGASGSTNSSQQDIQSESSQEKESESNHQDKLSENSHHDVHSDGMSSGDEQTTKITDHKTNGPHHRDDHPAPKTTSSHDPPHHTTTSSHDPPHVIDQHAHHETTLLNNIVVMNKLDPEPMVDVSTEYIPVLASRPMNGEVRSRSRSVPGPVNLGFSVRNDPSTMSREEALNHIAQADAARRQQESDVRSPEPKSPLIAGYPNITADLIREKLREKHGNTANPITNENLRVQYRDTPATGPIVIETATDLEPYMFSRNQQEISPDDTLKRIELLKKRRRFLSTDAIEDKPDETQADHDRHVQQRYKQAEEKILVELQQMKEKQRMKEVEIERRLANKLNSAVRSSLDDPEEGPDRQEHLASPRISDSEMSPRSMDGQPRGDLGRKFSQQPEDDSEVTDDYLRTKNIERTAETLDWYRHKRQTADTMCNARLNRLLAGMDQRYVQHQEDQVSRYISPTSHMAAAVLSGGRSSRSTTRSTTYGRRAQSSDRIRRYDRADGEDNGRPHLYASNPFDV